MALKEVQERKAGGRTSAGEWQGMAVFEGETWPWNGDPDVEFATFQPYKWLGNLGSATEHGALPSHHNRLHLATLDSISTAFQCPFRGLDHMKSSCHRVMIL